MLIRTLPFVAEEPEFALKDGTAINLFVRPLPRLSVDIDLTYLPVADRVTSLRAVNAALQRIAHRIGTNMVDARVQATPLAETGAITKLVVRVGSAQVKVEVAPVLRGTVHAPATSAVVPEVEDAFGFAEMQIVSFADLYAGKIVAAMDRQHPRDLFDVRDLLANEGITDDLRSAFAVHLASHGRPMAEVLAPTRKPLADEYARGFVGMTREAVPLSELENAREAIIEAMVAQMPPAHRTFLLGFERGTPDWDLLGLPEAALLPAVQWKQLNLDRLPPAKRHTLIEALERVLSP